VSCYFVGRLITLSMYLCSDCNCDSRGTVDGGIECDESGQCRCKTYVTGLRCNACPSGFFGLNASDADGRPVCMSYCQNGSSIANPYNI